MTELDLTAFSEAKGREIAKRMINEHDEASFEIDAREIEADIYTWSLHVSNGLFLENGSFNFDPQIEKLRLVLDYRLDATKREVQKLSRKEVLANYVKLCALDSLNDKGIHLF